MFIYLLQGICGNHTHPNERILRSQRIRSYFMKRTLNQECVGSSVHSVETYLIIDNATEADAGTYAVTVKAIQQSVTVKDEVNVTISKCTHYIMYP